MNQCYEYLLHGSVLEKHVGLLHERLSGLTDSRKYEITDHELVFSQRGVNPPVTLHVRRSLKPSQSHLVKPVSWHIRYVGQPEPMADPGRSCPVIMRKTADALANSQKPAVMMNFLGDLGFRIDYDYVMHGDVYTKGNMKITVAKVRGCKEPGIIKDEKIFPITDSRLVQISAILPYGQDSTVVKEMVAFGDQLKPIVNVEAVDFVRAQSQSAPPPR